MCVGSSCFRCRGTISCLSFGFRNISYPFRRQGDPSGCGVQSYELVCTDTKATIRIGSGTYDVLSINYTESYFWVVDASLSMQSSCPLPHWDRHASPHVSGHNVELALTLTTLATFVNCSQRIENNTMYSPVACLNRINSSSFIYVVAYYFSYYAGYFEPSCGYLAMTPLGGPGMRVPENASYPDVVKFMKKGFALPFPIGVSTGCFTDLMSEFRAVPRNRDWISGILFSDLNFWRCVTEQFGSANNGSGFMLIGILLLRIPPVMWLLKYMPVICRFVLGPIAIFTFLAHKYWKTRIAIDAVEKFLRMQQMLGGPLRFAYTDLTAITGHFRERLGQGGYGSVYKGVLLPGEVQVAVKMLSNSKCNGEEFINEVSTIGRIHHVNVVRLLGFCSEEMGRALVYEYMPKGSLDKYIFSLEKSFSWDKLSDRGVLRHVQGEQPRRAPKIEGLQK